MAEECCGWDFLVWMGPKTSTCVFRRLDDPADLVRAAAVSRSWRRFVVENDFCKSLCLRICPEVANFTRAVEVSRSPPPPQPTAHAPESCHDAELKSRERDYRIYSYLSAALVSTKPSMDCILNCIGASSTDNFPDESIENTLEPQDRVNHRPSYWSSGGQDDPDVPESLTYKLNSDICIIDEIRVQPFKAYFQYGHPIYSSKTVRFRMGHSKLPCGSESFVTDEDDNQMAIADKNYMWTYTSPEFPMLQENVLQSFKLPRRVLCIGGVVKVELLGRVHKQEADDKYYIWAFAMYIAMGGVSKQGAKGLTHARDFKCHQQPPSNTCGFYVCHHMELLLDSSRITNSKAASILSTALKQPDLSQIRGELAYFLLARVIKPEGEFHYAP